MAATIVAGVCEDHQDYELMEPSTTENPKKGQPFSYGTRGLTKLISTYFKHSQALLYTHTVGPYR